MRKTEKKGEVMLEEGREREGGGEGKREGELIEISRRGERERERGGGRREREGVWANRNQLRRVKGKD